MSERYKQEGYFTEQILSELKNRGFTEEEIREKLESMQGKIRPAVEAMIDEADRVAKGEGECFTMRDVFDIEE